MDKRVRIVVLFVVCLLVLSAFAVGAEKFKSKGVITYRSGDTLNVDTADGPQVVIITSDTKVQQPVGLTGARKKQMSPDVLIPGLRMSFAGTPDEQARIVATTITFDSDDLALAKVIQAGLNPTAYQQAQNMQTYQANKAATDAAIAAHQQQLEASKQMIAANQQSIEQVAQDTQKRFSELTDWAVKREAAVHFDVGSSVISPEHQQEIAAFAQEAAQLKGYVIEVKGYADSTGRLADNQQLSKERAQAVIAYLLQECRIPVKNIVAPGAMSVTHPVASNETGSGRAENRRVELRILVNKGVAGETGS